MSCMGWLLGKGISGNWIDRRGIKGFCAIYFVLGFARFPKVGDCPRITVNAACFFFHRAIQKSVA